MSDHVFGPYVNMGNPCRGPGSETTFGAQGTFVLPIDPEKGRFIFMVDRWSPGRIGESTYIWLPFAVGNGTEPEIGWVERWNPAYFEQ